MATTSLTSLGTQALFAAYAQLQTTSNNIANANTPGYSRQSAQLATAGSDYSGSGYFGRGVTVSTVSRASNMFLTGQALAAASTAAADSVRRDMLGQLEQVFTGGASGLGQAVTQIFNAFADLAAAPGDLAARQAVLGRLEDFASLARASAGQIEALQANVQHDVSGGVAEVNGLASALARLNGDITAAVSRGHTPNDLLDRRDALIRQIGEQVEVHVVMGPDESASLFVGSGQSLVLGTGANRLEAIADPDDPTRIAVGISVGGRTTPLSADAIGQGLIGGLLRFQEQDLDEARSRLGQLVVGLGSALNQQQALGLDLAGQPGGALLGLAPPQALPATTNARDGNGYLSSVSLAITDAAALKASDYRLAPDPANGGQYIVTRLSDGQVFQPVADGDSVDGFSITIGPNAPQPGESFTLKPVSQAAAGVALALRDPRGLAAASPVIGVAHPANTGTASIAALDIVAAPAGAYQALTLSFTDDVGSYEWRDGGGGVVAAGSFQAGQPIVHDGVALRLAGLPRAGDRILLTPTTQPAASNGNALRFDGMAESRLIDGETVNDAYAHAMANVGVRVQSATAAAGSSATVSARATSELSAQVGVNLDEEAARLIQYQQGYQAAAKMLQASQSMFDTLISLGR